MKKFVSAISTALVFAGSVYAQTDGQYMGRTSQNQPIQFIVSGGGTCVDQLGYAIFLGCPSGGRTSWGVGYGGCQTIQPDGSFRWMVPPIDSTGIVTYVVAGSFVAPDAAEGTINFQSAQLQVDPFCVGAQLCDSSIPEQVTWRAQRSMAPPELLNSETNQVITSTDQTGNASSSVKVETK